MCLFEDMAGSDYNTSRGKAKPLVGNCKQSGDKKAAGTPRMSVEKQETEIIFIGKDLGGKLTNRK